MEVLTLTCMSLMVGRNRSTRWKPTGFGGGRVLRTVTNKREKGQTHLYRSTQVIWISKGEQGVGFVCELTCFCMLLQKCHEV